MATSESIALAFRAKGGDRGAWEELCRRYYPKWLGKYHGRLGARLRRLGDTQDLIQSAVAEALEHIGTLRVEATFFAWVSTIIRRKLADYVRRGMQAESVSLEEISEPPAWIPDLGTRVETADDYVRLCDSILELFEPYPEHMAMFSLRYFEDRTIGDLMEIFEASERTVHRRLENAVLLLRSKAGLS